VTLFISYLPFSYITRSANITSIHTETKDKDAVIRC